MGRIYPEILLVEDRPQKTWMTNSEDRKGGQFTPLNHDDF